MKQTSLPKTWIFFFIIFLVLVVGAVLQSSVEKSSIIPVRASEESLVTTERQKTAEKVVLGSGNGIYIEDQKVGKTSVVIGFAVLENSGFVVIHEDDQGVPGKIIGHSDLLRGRTDTVIIQTEIPLKKNGVYYAILHRDNGDGKFLEVNDGYLNDKNNDVTLMSFLATE